MKKKEAKIIQKIKHSDNNLKLKDSSVNNCYSYNSNSFVNDKNITIKKFSIISKNLKKYSITKKIYNIYIINSIIFDQKNHIVTEFKNYLLWDETSEFLKRFYNLMESLERLPNISQYYETYTLFAPIYFGLEGSLLIIMNEWTRKKKNYLEYIEDKEEENEKNNVNNEKNINFKKLIKTNLICSESSDIQSKSSKKTLDLTKYDNVDSFFIKDSIDLSLIEKDQNNNIKKERIKNLSLSKIMDDLFNNYSVYNNNNYNIKNNVEKNKLKNISKNKKKEINKKEKNIISSDKVLFSFSNLYKNRNNNNTFQKKYKQYYFGTNNNSTSKIRTGQLHEKNKEKIFKCKINNKINLPLNETKKNNIKQRFNTQNNLQITISNLTRNKSNIREKKDKDNIKKNIITNTNNNTNINLTSYNNSTNNSLSKLKIRKQKIKKLYLRNLKLITPPYNYYRHMAHSPVSNTLDTNQNTDNYNNKNNSKCNLTRLLTYKNGKSKNYLLNGNIINLKNFNSTGLIKTNNAQTNYDPFSYNINKFMKEKRVITSTNSFSNKKINNSKLEKKSSNSKSKKSNIYVNNNKKLSNGNLIRNLVLSQFHSKKEIIYKSKNNLNTNNNNISHKMTSSLTKNITSRNYTLLKNKKRTFTKKPHKKLNDSSSLKPYKKELNKINLNFNFNINFNIDINKNRQKKYLLTHKNNLGYLTQRNQIIKGSKIINKSKSKSRGGDNSHSKNIMNALIKNMKKDNNYGLRKNIK